MTARDKLEAEDQRQAIFERDEYRCQHCGGFINARGTAQLAHVIPQTVANLRKYGPEVIHHPLNMKSVCSLRCNSAVLIGDNPVARDALVTEIRAALTSEPS